MFWFHLLMFLGIGFEQKDGIAFLAQINFVKPLLDGLLLRIMQIIMNDSM